MSSEIFQRGFLLIPHKLEFEEGEGYCEKISGRLATYVTKAEFDEILYHLSLSHNMQAQPCLKSSEDERTRTIEVYLGGTDEEEEGTWTTLYSRENIEVSWAWPLILSISSLLSPVSREEYEVCKSWFNVFITTWPWLTLMKC